MSYEPKPFKLVLYAKRTLTARLAKKLNQIIIAALSFWVLVSASFVYADETTQISDQGEPQSIQEQFDSKLFEEDSKTDEELTDFEKEFHVEMQQKTWCRDSSKTGDTWLDRTHHSLSAKLCAQVIRLDNWLGKDYSNKPAKGFLRFRQGIVFDSVDDANYTLETKVRGRIKLPNASNRFNLVFSDSDPTSYSSDEPYQKFSDDQDNQSTSLSWLAILKSTFKLDIDAGIHNNNGPQPFLRGQAKKEWQTSENTKVILGQDIFWQDDIGIGENTELTTEYRINQNNWASFLTSALFTEETEGVSLFNRLKWGHQVDDRRLLTYQVFGLAHTRPKTEWDEYGVTINFREQIWRPWFFYEVEPQVVWPDEYERKLTQRLIIRFEVQFGKDW